MSTDEELRLECVSDSKRPQEGDITTPANESIEINETDGSLLLTNPFQRPGVLRLRTNMNSLDASHQGMYTCIIPDSNGNIISINVGLYPHGFNGGFIISYLVITLLYTLQHRTSTNHICNPSDGESNSNLHIH